MLIMDLLGPPIKSCGWLLRIRGNQNKMVDYAARSLYHAPNRPLFEKLPIFVLISLLLIPFEPDLLIKCRVWVHFLVTLIYGGFWEILRCPSHSVVDSWRFKSTQGHIWLNRLILLFLSHLTQIYSSIVGFEYIFWWS